MKRSVVAITALLFMTPPTVATTETLRLQVNSAAITHSPDASHVPQVDVRLTEDGGRALFAFSAAHVGKHVVASIDGKRATPPIRLLTPLAGGIFILPVASEDEARKLATGLADGSASLSIELTD